ncbi:ABC transporter permease [Acidiferrimicrobium sp. IK]|uniref:ABC transporter permease n=1 Tax=Acidiferrimicrobium sp. IK TaxID=2871700 RepID=UPI0021CB687A|nr:ABC transporter permease [Acidiferrimicrobium sp. IK]MCU4184288.1 ABC transporter permease [Acidiferrimicrobium sp. IK]
MIRFVVRRAASALGVLVAVSILTFLIFAAIPNGNPALRLAGRTASPQDIAAVTKAYGFNKPIYVQYAKTMQQVFTGQIQSYTQHVTVMSQIKRGLPATVSLAIGATVLWLVVAIILGLAAALRAGSATDTSITVLGFAGISAPSFVVGAILLYLFAFKTHLFPNGGYVGITSGVGTWFHHMVLPWISLAVLYIGIYSQVLRSTVVETLSEDFVRTARAKGLSRRRILTGHVLRTSLIPLVSLWGLDFAGVVGGGAILVETVFNLHGVGQYVQQSVSALDVPPILVTVLFGAIFVVLLSALVDVIYAALDPRIRLAA